MWEQLVGFNITNTLTNCSTNAFKRISPAAVRLTSIAGIMIGVLSIPPDTRINVRKTLFNLS